MVVDPFWEEVERYRVDLRSIACHFMIPAYPWEDLMHDTLLHIRPHYPFHTASFTSIFYTSCSQRITDFVRKHEQARRGEGEPAYCPESSLVQKTELSIILDALRKRNPARFMAVILWAEGWDAKEASEMMGMKYDGYKSLLHRGKTALRVLALGLT